MKKATKSRKPFFLYDVVHADGHVVESGARLASARRMAKLWNDVVGARPKMQVSIRKAWKVMPIGASERKAVK